MEDPNGGAMQALILAGGLPTRLKPITDSPPMAVVPVCGHPFLAYQIKYQQGDGWLTAFRDASKVVD